MSAASMSEHTQMLLDDIDFDEELPVPCTQKNDTNVSGPETRRSAVCDETLFDCVSFGEADFRDDIPIPPDRNESSHDQTAASPSATPLPFDRALFESCSVALGTPCYRNPVYGPRSEPTELVCCRLVTRYPQVWEFIRQRSVATIYYVPIDAYDFHYGQRVQPEDSAPRVVRPVRNGNDGLVGALRVSEPDIVAHLFGPAVLYRRSIVVCTYERDTIPNHEYLYVVRMQKPKINDRSS